MSEQWHGIPGWPAYQASDLGGVRSVDRIVECCHGNGNKQDNRPGNLRYDTSSNNKRDQVRHGTHNRTSRTHCPRNHGLVRPNLSESVLRRRGVRSCWSCEKADSYCRNRGIMDQFEAIADKYYATLDIPVEFR